MKFHVHFTARLKCNTMYLYFKVSKINPKMCLSNTLYLHASVDVNCPNYNVHVFPCQLPQWEDVSCFVSRYLYVTLIIKKKVSVQRWHKFPVRSFITKKNQQQQNKTKNKRKQTRYLKLNVFLRTLNKHIKLAKKYQAHF